MVDIVGAENVDQAVVTASGKELAHRTRDPATGRLVSTIPPERKAEIVQSALERVISGETLADIAADHGITAMTLSIWLSALGDEYREAKAAYIDSRLARREQELEQATDALSQSRARELLRYAMWQAERRDPARYGQRPQGTGDVQITVVVER